ncbi:putative receptor-like protein kinase At1g72540 isoform X2 [Momordica charantia]|uniref:Receptor-like protein kinase At1g72540 isoform X2 n=1 Tax=Momordica charantia TaxID=3673 RepID=A0A6J1DDE8_MOMCH|nr:putative receptor-like protein kinase At1g72540 isoform X2 [Momordica charantia]
MLLILNIESKESWFTLESQRLCNCQLALFSRRVSMAQMLGSADSANMKVSVFTSQDLKAFTDNFNGKNLIGITHSGMLYRGQLRSSWSTAEEARNVTVKIWDQKPEFACECLVREEVKLLTQPSLKGHPSFANLVGYCCEDEVKGVVYDLNPLGFLQNLMTRDNFNWLQRVDVILELARLLDFIHWQEKPSLAFDFRASNILLDWECKPKLCGFAPNSNETVSDLNKPYKFAQIPSGYSHPSIRGGSRGKMSSDVYSLGEILLGLIAKRDLEHEKLEKQDHHQVVNSLVSIWAKNEYRPNASLVHETLQEDWGYNAEEGVRITELAMHCIEFFPSNRPSTKQVLQHLEGLQVAQRLTDVRPRKKERKFCGI